MRTLILLTECSFVKYGTLMLELSSQYAGYRWYDHALQKKNKKIKKEEHPCTKRRVSFYSRQFLLEFRRFEVSKRRIFPFYSSIEIMLDGEWKQRRNSTWIIISGAISIRFQDERKKHKDEEKVRYARLLLTCRLTNKLSWFC